MDVRRRERSATHGPDNPQLCVITWQHANVDAFGYDGVRSQQGKVCCKDEQKAAEDKCKDAKKRLKRKTEKGNKVPAWLDSGDKVKPGSDQRLPANAKWTYKDAREAGALANSTAFPHCKSRCIANQLDDHHQKNVISKAAHQCAAIQARTSALRAR